MSFRILLVIAGVLGFAAAVQSVAAATKSAHADVVSAKGTQIGTAKITSSGKGV
jgi:hypothetical protein